MTMSLFVIFKIILFTAISFSTCNEDVLKNSTHLTNFRKLVEETSADNSSDKENPESNNRFVSFLVENAKHIFGNSDPTVILDSDSENEETSVTLSSTSTATTTTTTTILIRKESTNDESIGNTFSNLEDLSDKNSDSTLPYNYRKKETNDSLNITDLSYNLSSTRTTVTYTTDNTGGNITDELLILEQKSSEESNQQDHKSGDASDNSLDSDSTKRSCIACDNVATKDCYDPKNKLINSRICDHEEDLCYSMHTPFGIVDRGCYNVNNNLSTYVCSCNLCNYISISEMPYIFTGKRDWVENVKEISRTKQLRKSILKDMSCLRCEVNATQKTEDMLDNANCLEGNINKLPMQECASNEICGVMAIKSESYVWRGCLSRPLYNYWFALCDTDLCNYDSLVSLYDEEF